MRSLLLETKAISMPAKKAAANIDIIMIRAVVPIFYGLNIRQNKGFVKFLPLLWGFPIFDKMKKAFIAFAVFILSFYVVGYLAIFYSLQYSAKSEIAERKEKTSIVNEKQITRITIPQNEYKKNTKQIKWYEEDEICMDGRMFDIVKVVRNGKHLAMYCLDDGKETNLFDFLNTHMAGTGTKQPCRKNKPIDTVGKFLTLKFIGTDTVAFFCMVHDSINHRCLQKIPVVNPYRSTTIQPPIQVPRCMGAGCSKPTAAPY